MTRASYKKGLIAKALCRLALRVKFYRIIASRYHSPFGEIDIIAMRGHTVALIEFKARASQHETMESILPRQRERLRCAANDFRGRYPYLNNHNFRFDIMLVARGHWPVHIADAWRPENPL
jgi:putative endonuclease